MNILRIEALDQLRCLSPRDLGYRILDKAEITHIFKLCDAFWMHSGDPRAAHVILTSGLHSNGFVNVLEVLKYANLCALFGQQIAETIDDLLLSPEFDWVIGSSHAATTISFATALWAGTQHGSTEKDPAREDIQRWRHVIEPGEVVLQVEELVTTAKTLGMVRKGIRECNPHPVEFAPAVATIVHRSKETHFEGSPIVYLVHYDIENWAAEECPLCAQGSEAIRPKTPAENWLRLLAGAA